MAAGMAALLFAALWFPRLVAGVSELVLLLAAATGWAQQDLPPGPGRDIVAAKCYACHNFDGHAAGGYTPLEWQKVLRMMVNQGAPLSPEELAEVAPYLAKNFPERARPAAVLLPGPRQVRMQVFPVATPGARPHDPLAARDGSLWYTGQMANVLGRIDPRSGRVREFALKTPHSGPHGLVEDRRGAIWYTGNTAALVGRLDPRTGADTEYRMPDPAVRDPHTLVFDAAGMLWFTAQVAGRIGRLDPATGRIRLLALPTPRARPYGMALAPDRRIYVVEFGTNGIAVVDPATLAVREFKLPASARGPAPR